MINEHAAEWRFHGEHQEADANLDDSGHQAEDLCEQNAQAIPEAKQNAD